MKNRNLKKTVASLVIILASTACSAESITGVSKSKDQTKSSQASVMNTQSLPTLHQIETYNFQAPYSCNGSYELSALFLSDYSKKRNAPDLLFNGACRSPLYIQASTAGDDFSLISDLGKVSLESVSAGKAFNYERTVGSENNFKESTPVTVGHSYVVLIAKREIRALYVLHVDDITSGGQMKISYAVKSYSIQNTQSNAPGFDWERGNQ